MKRDSGGRGLWPKRDDLMKKCVRVLQKEIGPGVSFREEERARGVVAFLLIGGASAVEVPGRGAYPVVPFLSDRSGDYWMSFELQLSPAGSSFRIRHASAMVVIGSRSDPNKRRLFRGEWDVESAGGRHAQPHWHVYLEGADVADAGPSGSGDLLGSEADRERKPAGGRAQLNGFHYAMASRWHTGTASSHCSDLGEESLLKWLAGWTTYTRAQLRFISE
jgi:hypothetical protein